MARTLQLLLTENVESTGIVGDVVTVRKGYARNFLLPRGFATTPSEEKIKALAAKRADAERMLAELRKQREELIKKLTGYELSMIRSCNDQGHLYAAVTQHDIAVALEAAGFHGIKDREVRLGGTIKRVDTYEIHVKFEADLEAVIKLWVMPDRKLDLPKDEPAATAPQAAATADGDAAADPAAPSEKRAKDRSARADKGDKAEKEDGDEKPAKESKSKDAGEKTSKGEGKSKK